MIDGSTAFTKSGDGTLLSSGANTYTGDTIISAGTLQLGAAAVIANASAVTVNGTFDLNDYNETISDLSGSGTVDLGSATLTTIQYNSTTYSGGITGTGSLKKYGGGVLTLSGSTDFTGGITIQVGTLQLGANNVIGDTNPITFADTDIFIHKATLDLNDYSDTVGTITANYTDAKILLGSGGLTINQANGADTSFKGIISETGTFTKSGAGALTLTNSNTYTGLTTITAGTLTLDQAGTTTTGQVIKDTNAVIVNGGTLDLADDTETVGALTLTDGSLTGTGNTIVGTSYTLNTGDGDTFTASAILGGSANLTKSEAGTTILSGANTYTGTTTVSGGILSVSGSLTSVSINNSATLTVSGALNDLTQITNTGQYNVQESDTIKTVSGSGNIAISATKTLTTGDNGDDTISGVISGAGSLTKVGTGTLTLSTNNTYTGATTISAGSVKVTGTLSDSTAVSVGTNGVYDVDATDTIASIAGAGLVDVAPGITLSAGNDSNATTFSGILRSSQVLNESNEVTTAFGSFTKVGSEALTLDGTFSQLSQLTISAGSLTLGANDRLNDSTPISLADATGAVLDLDGNDETIGSLSGGGTDGGNITLGAGALTIDQRSNGTYDGVISGTGSVTKTGVAALTLTRANTYDGGTTISRGQIKVGTNNALLNTGAVTINGLGTGSNIGDLVIANGVSQTIGTLIGNANGRISTVSSGSLTVTQGADQTFAGIIRGHGSFTKAGNSALTLSNDNNHRGTLTISAGTLTVSGTLHDTSDIVVNGGTYDVDASDTVRSISGAGAIEIASGQTLTTGDRSNDTISGVISGAGSLTKVGTGTLTLSTNNTYTGATTISAGSVKVTGTLSDSTAVSVGANGVYDVDATDTIASIAGAGLVDVAPGITLSAGNDNNATTFSGILRSSQVLNESNEVTTAFGSFTKVGSEALTLDGTFSQLSQLTISAGSLTLGANDRLNDSTPISLADATGAVLDLDGNDETIGSLSGGGTDGGNITLGAGALTIDQRSNGTYDGVISGTGSVTKTGVAALTLTRANTYDGGTTISRGQIKVGTNNALLNTGAVTINGLGTGSNIGDLVIANGVSQTIGTLIGNANGRISTVSSGSLTVTQGADQTFAGIIRGHGSFTKAGNSALTLSNDNNHRGTLTISAGTLTVSGTLHDTSDIVVNGGTYDVDANDTIKSIAGSGGTINVANNITLTQSTRVDKTYAGTLEGAGTFTKTGASTLTLSGTSTISNITITKDRLKVTGSLGTSTAVSVGANGVYDVDATDTIASIAGAGLVDVAPGITLSAGNDNNATTFSGILRSSQVLNESNEVTTAFGSFTKVGSEALTLDGTFSQLSQLTISAGSLTLGANDRLNDSTPISLADATGAVLDLDGNDETIGSLSGGGTDGGNITLGAGALTIDQRSNGTYDGVISGTGSVTKTGVAALTLTRANTYDGGTTISRGQIKVGTNNALLNTGAVTINGLGTGSNIGDLVIANGVSQTIGTLIGNANGRISTVSSGSLTVTQGADQTFAGIIRGHGSFTKAGNSALTLSNDNNHRGTLTISAGTLTVSGTLHDTSDIVVNGGTYDVDASDTVRSISGAGAIEIASGQTLTTGDRSNDTISGVISGAGSLTKVGTGTLTLSTNNTYTGATTISAGSVKVTGTLSDSTAVSVGANGVYDVDATDTIASIAGAGLVDVAPGITLSAGNDNNATTFSGILRSSQVLNESNEVTTAFGSFTKVGSEALTLDGTFSQLSQLTISAGSLTLGANDRLNDSTPISLADATGAVLDLDGNDETIGSLSGGGTDGGNITLGAGALTIDQRSNGTYDGVISGTGSVTKTGVAALTLTRANTYDGGTTISRGQIKVGTNNALLNTGAVTINGLGTGSNIGDLVIANGVSQTIGTLIGNANGRISTVSSGSLTVTQGADQTFAGIIRGHGSFTKAGNSALTLSNDNNHRGTLTISAGTLTVSGTLHDTSDIVVNGGTYDVDASDTVRSISGAGAIEIASGQTLTTGDRSNDTISGVISGAGSLTKVGTGTLTLSTNNTYTGATTISAGSVKVTGTLSDSTAVSVGTNGVYDVDATDTIASIAGAGLVDVAPGITLSAGNDNNATTFSGILRSSQVLNESNEVTTAFGSFTKVGSEALTLDGTFSQLSQLTISAGSLTLGANDRLNDSTPISLADATGAVLDLDGNDETIGSLSGGGTDGGNITLGAGALTIDQRSNGTYDGVISGTGSVTKTGVAALTLTRANTYDGGTTISRGQIKVGTNNALLNTGAVTMSGTGAADLVLPDGTSQTIGTLSGTNSNAMLNLLGSSSLTITQSSNTNFAGNIRGDGSLVKNGSSDLTFTNAVDKHTGLTTINAGSLVYANNSEIGAVTIANVAGATLDINGGTTTIRTLIGNDRSDIDFGTNGTLIVYQGSDQSYEGTLSGTGTISKRGSGKINRFGSTIVNGNSNIAGN